jgi:hypothetical protein
MAVADLRKRSLRVPLALGAMALVACGCASVSVRSHAYLATPRYPPTAPDTVQILAAEPNQPKDRLGEIILNVSGNPSRDMLENKLRKAAAALGANAVFISSDKTRIYPVVYYDWWYPPWVYQDSVRNIIAVAIRLK